MMGDTMDVTIVYTDNENLTIKTTNRKTTNFTVVELNAIVEAYADVQGKLGDGCSGIETSCGDKWYRYAAPNNKE